MNSETRESFETRAQAARVFIEISRSRAKKRGAAAISIEEISRAAAAACVLTGDAWPVREQHASDSQPASQPAPPAPLTYYPHRRCNADLLSSSKAFLFSSSFSLGLLRRCQRIWFYFVIRLIRRRSRCIFLLAFGKSGNYNAALRCNFF